MLCMGNSTTLHKMSRWIPSRALGEDDLPPFLPSFLPSIKQTISAGCVPSEPDPLQTASSNSGGGRLIRGRPEERAKHRGFCIASGFCECRELQTDRRRHLKGSEESTSLTLCQGPQFRNSSPRSPCLLPIPESRGTGFRSCLQTDMTNGTSADIILASERASERIGA